ncbi:MAG: hypothetical protein AAGA03_10030 [Planctomycetota bacterium]
MDESTREGLTALEDRRFDCAGWAMAAMIVCSRKVHTRWKEAIDPVPTADAHCSMTAFDRARKFGSSGAAICLDVGRL